MSSIADSRICILDAGPLIHLDQLQALDLLFRMGKVFVPESVAWEAEKHRPGIRTKIEANIVEDVEKLSEALTAVLMDTKLHAGEIAALAWAEKFGADLFVSDDEDARVVATFLGYRSTGTLGVIRNACRNGGVPHSEAVNLLKAIPLQSSLHVKASLLAEVIASLR